MPQNPYAAPAAELKQAASTDDATSSLIQQVRLMPVRVRASLALLLIAWIIAIGFTYFTNHLLGQRATSLDVSMGIFVLNVAMVGIYLMAAGNSAARIIAGSLALLSAPDVYYNVHATLSISVMWALIGAIGYIIMCMAIALLFGGSSEQWFERTPASHGVDPSLGDTTITQVENGRRWPPIAVVTLILSGVGVAVSIYGLIHLAILFVAEQGDSSRTERYMEMAIHGCAWLAISSVAFYSTLHRPSWGRIAAMCFALWIGIGSILAAILPDPHPRFPINGPEEEFGALIGQLLIVGLSVTYLVSMAFGRNARSRFALTTMRR